MMATVPHVTYGLGLRKFQADGFLLTQVYNTTSVQGTIQKYLQRSVSLWCLSLKNE